MASKKTVKKYRSKNGKVTSVEKKGSHIVVKRQDKVIFDSKKTTKPFKDFWSEIEYLYQGREFKEIK